MNEAIIVALVGLLGVVTAAWVRSLLTGRNDRRNGERQFQRDQQGRMHAERACVYGELDAWISTVVDQADDICYGDDLAKLPAGRRTEYDLCVALHQGVLRLPRGGQYLWGTEVVELVTELQEQAVAMATAVMIQGLRAPQDHGHDKLEATAVRLRRAMRDDLERNGGQSDRTAHASRSTRAGQAARPATP